jgi:hypothetical protein
MFGRCLCLAILALVSLDAAAQPGQPAKGCDASLVPLCLPAEMSSRKPFQGPDFVVNEIDLASGGHLAIYQGIGLSEQEGVTGITKEKSYGGGDTAADVYVGASPHGRYFDVLFRHAGMYGVVQIFGYLASGQDAVSAGKFIAGIQYCPRGVATCALTEPLVDAGEYIVKLQ